MNKQIVVKPLQCHNHFFGKKAPNDENLERKEILRLKPKLYSKISFMFAKGLPVKKCNLQ